MGPGKGPIETSYSSANHAVLHAPNGRWGLGTIGTCISSPKLAVLHAKTRYESWNKLRLVILNLSMLFCMHKSTGEVWVPQRLVIVKWCAKIDHFPQKVILIYALSKCNGGAFFERELRIPFISRRNKLRAAAMWRSYVLPCRRYEHKSIDLSSRSA